MPFEHFCCPQVMARMPEQWSVCVGTVTLPWLLSFKQKSVHSPSEAAKLVCCVLLLFLNFIYLWFTSLQFYELFCDNMTVFSKQICMVVHKYINIPYRVKIDVFSWVAQQFFGLVPSSFYVFVYLATLLYWELVILAVLLATVFSYLLIIKNCLVSNLGVFFFLSY